MRTLALYNLKGGVGKTACAVNLAYLAALDGRRVLIWDLDPQGAASFYFRIAPEISGGRKALLEKKNRKRVHRHIRGTDFDRLDLLPADFSYRMLDVALDQAKRPERQLGRLLEPLAEDYDLVFLDCPPSLSRTSESVFEASDALLVPTVPTTLSLRTLAQLGRHLERKGPHDVPVWPFFSMVDRRKRLHLDVMAGAEQSEFSFFAPTIPQASDIERMGLERRPVSAFAPSSTAALAYLSLWTAIDQRLRSL